MLTHNSFPALRASTTSARDRVAVGVAPSIAGFAPARLIDGQLVSPRCDRLTHNSVPALPSRRTRRARLARVAVGVGLIAGFAPARLFAVSFPSLAAMAHSSLLPRPGMRGTRNRLSCDGRRRPAQPQSSRGPGRDLTSSTRSTFSSGNRVRRPAGIVGGRNVTDPGNGQEG